MAKGKASAAGKTPGSGAEGEVFSFQTEMQQLLQILVHSLYSEREVFLRELISNASDAINRLKFRMQTESNVRDPDAELAIDLAVDTDGKALIISDSGSGMTRQEMIDNLGTIARSGTLEFVKQLSAAEPGQRMDLIGQFGVGFYSVFMVASRVVVDSCPADPSEPPTRWISEGHGEYRVEPGERAQRGTTIRVELQDESEEYARAIRLEDIVQRYSAFISHPIRLDGRQLNTQPAIWSLAKQDVSAEQYHEFYKFLSHGTEDPLHTLHLSIDAPVQYRALVYVPPHLTNEVLYSPQAYGLQLYANKVLIQGDSKELLPLYLRFLRGVVDTEDLPLNVSRETVQNNPLLARLRTSLTGRVLRDFAALAKDDAEAYNRLWLQYGKVIKEGLTSDAANKERLVELLRFNSSHCAGAEELTTLSAYVERMSKEQEEIYYFTGPSREAIENHPHLEYFRKQKLEVLYLFDQVDDLMMPNLGEFEGKPVVSVDQADLAALQGEQDGADSGAAKEGALQGEQLEGLLGLIKDVLGEQVSEVRASKRLVDSPALLLSADGIPGNLQKLMRALNKDFKSMPKILEINPGHEIVRHMNALRLANPAHPTLRHVAEQLFENCLLLEGLLEHPERMVTRLQALMARAAQPHGDEAPAADEAADKGEAPAADESPNTEA